jgi:hypothetical protein
MKILRAWPESKKDYLFGAGIFGQIVSEIFPNRWIAIVDNNKPELFMQAKAIAIA